MRTNFHLHVGSIGKFEECKEGYLLLSKQYVVVKETM